MYKKCHSKLDLESLRKINLNLLKDPESSSEPVLNLIEEWQEEGKLSDFISLEKWKTFFDIKVIPNSPKTEFVEKMENWVLKIRWKWVPEKGKVNSEIIKYFSKELKIDKKNIEITSWKTSSLKKIKISI